MLQACPPRAFPKAGLRGSLGSGSELLRRWAHFSHQDEHLSNLLEGLWPPKQQQQQLMETCPETQIPSLSHKCFLVPRAATGSTSHVSRSQGKRLVLREADESQGLLLKHTGPPAAFWPWGSPQSDGASPPAPPTKQGLEAQTAGLWSRAAHTPASEMRWAVSMDQGGGTRGRLTQMISELEAGKREVTSEGGAAVFRGIRTGPENAQDSPPWRRSRAQSEPCGA